MDKERARAQEASAKLAELEASATGATPEGSGASAQVTELKTALEQERVRAKDASAKLTSLRAAQARKSCSGT